MRWRQILLGVALAAALPRTGSAVEEPSPSPSAFDRPLAIAGYGVGWAGTYEAAGVGGRLQWEFLPHRLGLDLLMDALVVESAGALRHDHPIGFSVYAPFAIGSRVRIRPMLGACVVFSFVGPSATVPTGTSDVLFGVHGGAGVEVLVVGRLSVFVDLQAIWYLGHDQTQSWGTALSENLGSTFVVQPTTGAQIHFG